MTVKFSALPPPRFSAALFIVIFMHLQLDKNSLQKPHGQMCLHMGGTSLLQDSKLIKGKKNYVNPTFMGNINTWEIPAGHVLRALLMSWHALTW